MNKTICFCGLTVVDNDVLCEKHLALRTKWEAAMKKLAEDFKKQHPDG